MQQFDDIYNNEITKRYHNHELKRLSARKAVRKREIGAGSVETRLKRQIFNASCLLPTLHNL